MAKTNRKAKTVTPDRLALSSQVVEPDRRLVSCVATPERDAVLERIMVELGSWPTYHLIHLLPALAAHTGRYGSDGGEVRVSLPNGSLWDRLEKLDRRDSR